MTVIIESLKFTCNRCGGDMTYEETKLGMKWTNVEKPENIHLCYDCGKEVEAFANGKIESTQPPEVIVRANVDGPTRAVLWPGHTQKKYPTMRQLLKDSKKKYGNQHKKVVRK